jgi:deoxycytidylate deaminase
MNNKDLFYMRIAEIVSEQSKCIRAQVGAILVKDGNVIAIGYNGTPSGFCNDCEKKTLLYQRCYTQKATQLPSALGLQVQPIKLHYIRHCHHALNVAS